MSEIAVYISTFLLAEESNKLHFFQGPQWPWVKVAINHRIGSKWRLLFDCWDKRDCGIESGSRTF